MTWVTKRAAAESGRPDSSTRQGAASDRHSDPLVAVASAGTTPTDEGAQDEEEPDGAGHSAADGRQPVGPQVAACGEEESLEVLELVVGEVLGPVDLPLLDPLGVDPVHQRLDRGSEAVAG